MEVINKYVQFSEPNKAALANLLERCKGSERTMAQFAEECSISPSTLSRILNRNITKPLSEDMLKSIYKHRVNGCKVEMDDLYQANGMFNNEDRNWITSEIENRRMGDEKKNLVQQTLITELLKRGYAVKADFSWGKGHAEIKDSRTDKERGDISISYSLGVILPELQDLSEWVFQIYAGPVQVPSHVTYKPVVPNAKATIRRMMQWRSDIFLIDAWQPERLNGMKYSWVFTDSDLYDAFREYTKIARLNNAMSTILIDLNAQVVLKEEWMNCPMKNDYVSLFGYENDGKQGTDYEYRPKQMIGTVRRPDPRYDEEDSE